MKFLCVVLLFGLCAIVHSDSTVHHHTVPITVDFLQKQKSILFLFKNVHQKSTWKDHIEIADKFDLHTKTALYTKPEVVDEFLEHLHDGFLQKGEIFSVFHHEHWHQAHLLFKLFYYAKDFQTFYQTAVWARQTLNEGLYVYALSVAIAHRPDTYGIVTPPIYETFPHLFFNAETIETAHYHKMTHQHSDTHKEVHTIESTYSGHYLNLHPDQSTLSYFLEDVGINAFYHSYHIHYPVWMCGKEFGLENDKRGEQYYFIHQQMLARYYLERLSHGMGEIDHFTWETPFKNPYTPSMQYPNGLAFPSRPQFADLEEVHINYGQEWFTNVYGHSHTIVQSYERRIRDAIDLGLVLNKHGERLDLYTEGVNLLGNIIEANHDSPNNRFYGPIEVFARHLLGYSHQALDDHKVAPSALEHYETTLRDPAAYQLFKKIMIHFMHYQSFAPAYNKTDLQHPDYVITEVKVDPLITYFDHFDSDLQNAVYNVPQDDVSHDFKLRVRQKRLNHKAFTYDIHVTAQKDDKVMVKVFLGPKHDHHGHHVNLTDNRINFVLFDVFRHSVKKGENVLKRTSHDSPLYAPDHDTFDVMHKKIVEGAEHPDTYQYDWRHAWMTWPERLRLPHGTVNGMDMQFFVVVYPCTHAGDEKHHDLPPKVGSTGFRTEHFSAGYPLDRVIRHEHHFHHATNMHMHDVKVYHKNVEEINAVHRIET